MKNQLIPYFLLFLGCLSANSQEYRRFKTAIGIPFAPVTTDQFSYYGGFYLEPSYRIGSRPVGIHISILQSNEITTRKAPFTKTSEVAGIINLCGFIDRYIKHENPRVFTGLMAGTSYHGFQTYERFGGIETIVRKGFLLAPRIGFNYGHFGITLMYQVVSAGLPDLLTFQAGIDIGGGKKKNKSGG